MQRTPRIREFARIKKIAARGPVSVTGVPPRAMPVRRLAPRVRLAGVVLRFHVV